MFRPDHPSSRVRALYVLNSPSTLTVRSNMTKKELVLKSADVIERMLTEGSRTKDIAKKLGVSRTVFYEVINSNDDLKRLYKSAQAAHAAEYREYYEAALHGCMTGQRKIPPEYLRESGSHSRWLSSKAEQGYKDESKAMMQIKDGDKEINIGWMTSGSDNDTV